MDSSKKTKCIRKEVIGIERLESVRLVQLRLLKKAYLDLPGETFLDRFD